MKIGTLKRERSANLCLGLLVGRGHDIPTTSLPSGIVIYPEVAQPVPSPTTRCVPTRLELYVMRDYGMAYRLSEGYMDTVKMPGSGEMQHEVVPGPMVLSKATLNANAWRIVGDVGVRHLDKPPVVTFTEEVDVCIGDSIRASEVKDLPAGTLLSKGDTSNQALYVVRPDRTIYRIGNFRQLLTKPRQVDPVIAISHEPYGPSLQVLGLFPVLAE